MAPGSAPRAARCRRLSHFAESSRPEHVLMGKRAFLIGMFVVVKISMAHDRTAGILAATSVGVAHYLLTPGEALPGDLQEDLPTAAELSAAVPHTSKAS